jgi:RND family efflux transporter MFP subunit
MKALACRGHAVALSAPTVLPLACLALLAAAPARAQGLDCMIQPNQIVQVGSPVAGVVEAMAVERGDLVRRGQVLVQLQAQVERAALAMAKERAEQVGEVAAASGARELAQRELARANELFGDQFVSRTYVDRAQAEAAVAGGRTEQAQERRRLSERELALAAAQLAQRTLRSPIDGVVVDRFLAPGEFVEQKPLLRIASIDPLRVDVLVPAAAFGRVQVGAKANVVPELFNRSQHVAVVKTVDRVIDAASNTFRVRLELPNPKNELPAGLRCKVDLGVPTAAPGLGAQAAQPAQGANGAQGAQGAQSAQGTQGAQSAQGTQGAPGVPAARTPGARAAAGPATPVVLVAPVVPGSEGGAQR